MPNTWLTFSVAAAGFLLVGCNKTPTDETADAVARSGRARSEGIQTQADAQAKALDQRSVALRAQAKQTGGYTGQRLNVQADALAREADIVRRQGKAQGESTQEAADAQAKGIRSR
jgi:hypothetical protein